MDLLRDRWNSIWKQQAQDWTFAPLSASQVPDNLGHQTIQPNAAYINVFLRSMRIVNVRRGLSKFYGTVHSHITVPYISGEKASFQVVSTPSNLRDIDAVNLDRIILMNHRLLGPIPYRGGDIDMELGLFSVKSADLAGPFISVLEQLSSAAGVSFINVAQPFMAPLLQGVNLLLGTQGDTVLELGWATTMNPLETGYFVLIRAQRGAQNSENTVNVESLKVNPDFKLVDDKGQPLSSFPYMVVSIEASSERDNWFEIPELADARNKLEKELKTGSEQSAQQAFAMLKRLILTSPDLIDEDASKLTDKVDEKYRPLFDVFFPQVATRGIEDERELVQIPTLRELNLYDH